MSKLTREMLKRCQNELKQAFCALDKDVQEAISGNRANVMMLDKSGQWKTPLKEAGDIFYPAALYGLSPDTPTEPEWEELPVVYDAFGLALCSFGPKRLEFWLANMVSYKTFLCIIYFKDGTETLRTSVDAAFGTPVRVRFAK